MAALSVQSLTTVQMYLCGLSFLKIVLVGAPRSFVPLTDTWGHEHWGEVSECGGGGDKSWHQTLLFASDKSVCFVRNKQEWFCTNSWLIRTATLSKFWKRVQNPTTFGGSLKEIGLALFLVIHRLWLLKAIGFCFLSIDFWYILFQSNVTKVSY